MKKNIIAAFSIASLFAAGSSYAGDSCLGCIKGYAKTVDEAFDLGIKIARDAQFKLGDGEEDAHLHIMPKKDDVLYLVQVCPSGCEPDAP